MTDDIPSYLCPAPDVVLGREVGVNPFNFMGPGGINNPTNQEASDGAEIIGVAQGVRKTVTHPVDRYGQLANQRMKSDMKGTYVGGVVGDARSSQQMQSGTTGTYAGMDYQAPRKAKFAVGARVCYRDGFCQVLSATVNPTDGETFYMVHIDGTAQGASRNVNESSLKPFDASVSSQFMDFSGPCSVFQNGQDVMFWSQMAVQGQDCSKAQSMRVMYGRVVEVINAPGSPELQYRVQMKDTGNFYPYLLKSSELTACVGSAQRQEYHPPVGWNQACSPGPFHTTIQDNHFSSPQSGPTHHGSSSNNMAHAACNMAHSSLNAHHLRPVAPRRSTASPMASSDFLRNTKGPSLQESVDASVRRFPPSAPERATFSPGGPPISPARMARGRPTVSRGGPAVSPVPMAQPVNARTKTPDRSFPQTSGNNTPMLTPLGDQVPTLEVEAVEIPAIPENPRPGLVPLPPDNTNVPMPEPVVPGRPVVEIDREVNLGAVPPHEDVSYRRTMSEMRAQLDYPLFPDDTKGIPEGPFPNIEAVDYALKCWAGEQHQVDRGFTLTKDGVKNAKKTGQKQHGDRQRFICKQCRDRCREHNARGMNLGEKFSPMEFWFEHCKEGWYFLRCSGPHVTHSWKTSEMEVRIDPNSRCMPEEIAVVARDMASQGKDASCIMDVLAGSARRLKIPVSWTIEYIRTHFVLNTVNKIFDATDLVALLRARKEHGMKFYIDLDGDLMTRCFVQMDNSFDEWAAGGRNNVLFVDATHGTNQAGLKLCCFTTISSTGQTVILAFGLIRHEDALSYEWMFRRFHDIFKVRPLVMFTDSAIEIAMAFNEVSRLDDDATNAGIDDIWTETQHFLCTYHISRNLHSNCAGFFTGNPAGWRKFCNKFWRICLQTDERTKDTILQDLADLETIMINECNIEDDADKPHAGLKWLRETLTLKYKQWAARFTWSFLTHGAHSSQRAESIHRAVKRRIHRGLRVTELVAFLVEYNKTSRDKKEIDVVYRMTKQVAAKNTDLPLYLMHLVKPVMQITPYALNHLLAQYAQCRHYASSSTATVYTPILKTESYLQDLSEQHFTDMKHSYDYLADPTTPLATYPDGFMATYQLTRIGHVSADIPAHTEDGEGNEAVGDATVACDFGLHEGPEFDQTPNRRCSMYCCTCQLDKALKLPCRHQMWCWEEKQRCSPTMLEFPLACIGAKWKNISVSEQLVLSNALRDVGITEEPVVPDAQPGNSNDVHRPAFVVPSSERFKLLLRECSTLCEYGVGNLGTFNTIRSGIRDLVVKVSRVPTNPAQAQVEQQKERTTTPRLPNDPASLTSILGCQLEIVPFDEAKKRLDNIMGFGSTDDEAVDVAIKYGNKTRGQWVAGTVFDLSDEDVDCMSDSNEKKTIIGKPYIPNYKVEYKEWSDELNMYVDTYEYEYLAMEHYCTTGLTENAEKFRWCLLQNKPTGATEDEMDSMQIGRARVQSQVRKRVGGKAPSSRKKRK